MAINHSPMYAWGQDLTPEQLANARRHVPAGYTPGQFLPSMHGSGGGAFPTDAPYYPGYEAADPSILSRPWAANWLIDGAPDPSNAPMLRWSPGMRREGVGEASSEVPTFDGAWRIEQPRNSSTWGNSDTGGVWDGETGRWLGYESGGTALRGMANLVAQAVGGYYGTQYLNGLEGAAAAGGSGAGAGDWLGVGGAGGGSAIDASVAQMAAQPIAAGASEAAAISGYSPTIAAGAGGAAGAAAGGEAGNGAFVGEGAGSGVPSWDSAMRTAAGDIPWANIAGAALGAYQSRDQQQTGSRDPWAPAQPFLQQLLGQGQQLAQQYQQQPFSQQQQTAYNNVGGLLNAINSGAGGLLSGMQANASGANNYDRGNPRRPLQGSSFSLGGFQPGLLNFFPQTGGR